MWTESIKECLTVNSLPFFICGQPGEENKQTKITALLISIVVYLQLSKIEFELAKLKAEFQVGGVFVPKLVQRPLRLVHLN